jgi:hypothetical protein
MRAELGQLKRSEAKLAKTLERVRTRIQEIQALLALKDDG